MISPELLRRYPLFAPLAPEALRAVAMLTETQEMADGEVVVEADAPADALFLLQDGAAELSFVVRDARSPSNAVEHFITELNVGELFGIAAMVEPYVYGRRVRSRGRSHVFRIDAAGLRALCSSDPAVELSLQRGISRAALERLHATELQLAAHHP